LVSHPKSEDSFPFLFPTGPDRHMLARNVLGPKIVNCLPARGHKTWRTTRHITRWRTESRPDSVPGSVGGPVQMAVALILNLNLLLTQSLLWLFDWLRVKQLNFRLAPPFGQDSGVGRWELEVRGPKSVVRRPENPTLRLSPCSHACNYACLRRRRSGDLVLKIQFTLFGTQLNWSCARVLVLLPLQPTSFGPCRLSHDARNLLAVLFWFMAFFRETLWFSTAHGLGNFFMLIFYALSALLKFFLFSRLA